MTIQPDALQPIGMSPDLVRVAAVSAHAPLSPAFRARVSMFQPELRKYAVCVDPFPLFTNDEGVRFRQAGVLEKAWVATRARRRLSRSLGDASFTTSVALVQRQADMFPLLSLERRATDRRRFVWDVDDALWADASRAAGGHRLAFLKGSRRKARWLARRADHVIAATEILASHLERYTNTITVIPTPVNMSVFAPRVHTDGDRELVIGWIGSPTTAPYLSALEGVLRAVASGLGSRPVRFLAVGGDPPSVPGVIVDARGWSPDAERQALEEIDIGVMPAPDTSWTRGKAAYKAIVYMAAGIPVVADDVGVAKPTIADGGIVVSSSDEWVDGLRELAMSADLRARTGAAGRIRAEREYSVKRWAPIVAAILRGEDPPPQRRTHLDEV